MEILEEGVEIGDKGTIVIDETGVTYIHPCISEAGRVAAESKLSSGPEGAVDLKSGFFDPMMKSHISKMEAHSFHFWDQYWC